MRDTIISLKNITKTYGGVVALNNLSIEFKAGEVHALLGENGAGKSTLIKTIAGAIIPDSGKITLEDGSVYSHMTPKLSKEHGIEVVYQELNLVECLSVAENICLGERRGKFVDYKYMRDKAREAFELFDMDIDPKTEVYTLPVSKKQIVEIAKAITKKVKMLILDEPTGPLSSAEAGKLFQVVNKLRKAGVAIVYISHRMDEIFELADKVTVMRDGSYIDTLEVKKTNRKELISLMVGRELKESFPQHKPPTEEVVLKVEGMYGNGDKDISFELHKGEILGFAGLVGAGRTEMARVIAGADKMEAGKIYIHGDQVHIRSPYQGIKHGIGMVPEDRKLHGCLLGRAVKTNVTLSCLRNISKLGFVNRKREKEIARSYVDRLRVKTPNLSEAVGNLSGGNQQKVVLAKILAAECQIILFDEPTRGIDVGAKQEIYNLMAELVNEGKSIIMITSDMEELLGMSDRILVMYEGRIKSELRREEYSQQTVLTMASGLEVEEV